MRPPRAGSRTGKLSYASATGRPLVVPVVIVADGQDSDRLQRDWLSDRHSAHFGMQCHLLLHGYGGDGKTDTIAVILSRTGLAHRGGTASAHSGASACVPEARRSGYGPPAARSALLSSSNPPGRGAKSRGPYRDGVFSLDCASGRCSGCGGHGRQAATGCRSGQYSARCHAAHGLATCCTATSSGARARTHSGAPRPGDP
jgi:hypothetical protein